MKKITLSLFVFLLILTACSNKNDHKTDDKKTQKLLNDNPVIDEELNISFKTPLNWKEMNTALSEKMVARIRKRGEDEFIVYSPKSFFFEDSTNSLLRVGEVNLKDKEANGSLSIEQYSELFKKYNREFNIESEKINNTNFNILQMKLTRNNLVSFKYIFMNHSNQIIQFDFSIRKENIKLFYPQIIASVKSIRLL